MIDIVKLLSPLMNKNMKKDLIFYLEHDDPLYFKGMVGVAICYILLSVTSVIMSYWAIRSGAIWAGGLMVLFAAVFGMGFGVVKMYLHIRKDNLEILEALEAMKHA